MIRVLDAHGLLVFLEKEAGHGKVEQSFVAAVEKDEHILMASVNFGKSTILFYVSADKTKPMK